MNKYSEILIADDDLEDHDILQEYFRAAGVENRVMFVTNGLRALEFLESIEDDRMLPKLIVLDLNMPILNGTQTLQRIKQSSRLRNIEVIIFSTSTNEIEQRRCLSYGAADYVVKPMTYEEGRKLVDRFISSITKV